MRVLLVEGREVVRRGLADMASNLGFVDGLESVASLDDVDTGPGWIRPDVVVVGQPLQLHRLLAALGKRVRVVVLLDSAEPASVMAAVQLDAHGYLLLDDLTSSRLGDMLRDVVAGAIALPPEIARYLLAHARGDTGFLPHQHLTAREAEVLILLTEGLSNHQIAQRLRISIHGAKRHVSNLLAKLNSPNRAQAVAKAIQSGLVGRSDVIDLTDAHAVVAAS